MKRVLLALALIGLGAGAALAQPTNLAGGVFITHYPPGIVWSDAQDWCADYASLYSISSCEEQNPMIAGEEHAVWYVLAAFPADDKVWCGAEFGLYYDQPTCLIGPSGQCPTDALIIPSGAPYGVWPAPGSGVAISTTATPWSGNYQPVFWFTSYAYLAGVVQLGVNPATGFGGFANCMTPPAPYVAACFGAMGMLMPGVACCPEAPPLHVCCVGEVCSLVADAQECTDMGGIDHPEWTSCTDPSNPCEIVIPMHVCCVGEQCFVVPETECTAMSGVWHPELDACESTTCQIIVPTDPSSWGAIKAIYR
jgi:hypothetical protein